MKSNFIKTFKKIINLYIKKTAYVFLLTWLFDLKHICSDSLYVKQFVLKFWGVTYYHVTKVTPHMARNLTFFFYYYYMELDLLLQHLFTYMYWKKRLVIKFKFTLNFSSNFLCQWSFLLGPGKKRHTMLISHCMLKFILW